MFPEVLRKRANDESKKFESFSKTFKIYSFLLAAGCMYPNVNNEKKRKTILIFIIVSCLPFLGFMIYDMRLRVQLSDLENFVRQVSVFIAVVFLTLKQVLTIYKGKELREIIDAIDIEYEMFNYMPEVYQEIALNIIEKAKIFEKVWIVTIMCGTFAFPAIAVILTIYSQLFTEDPRTYMLHEVIAPGSLEELKYETPYYEVFFLYSLYIILLLFQGYSGYDGIFSVCIFHAILKLEFICYRLHHLLDDVDNIQTIKRKLRTIVQIQCQTYKFIEEIQQVFGIWLASIFFISVIQIVLTLVLTTIEDTDSSANYYVFAVVTIIQLYIPCYLTSEITVKAADIANSAYCSSWETISDIGIRRSIINVMARAQIPLYFKALNMLTFNMEMFVSLMQTAYSFFTLLRN